MPRPRRTVVTAALLLAGLAIGGPALPNVVSTLVSTDAGASERREAGALTGDVAATAATAPTGAAPAVGPTTAPDRADRGDRCVRASDLARVELGMTLAEAKRQLRSRDVWWGPTTGSWSQSFPVACSSARAMLVQADGGRVTFVVNEGERRSASCTSTVEFDAIGTGMSRTAVGELLQGKDFDLRRASEWQPVPCLGWSTMQLRFAAGRVTSAQRQLYFG